MKISNWLFKNKWVVLPLMYLTLCIWTYFTATLEIQGQALPRHEAGMWSLVVLHVMGLLAVLGAYLLHVLVELISRIFKPKH